MKKLAIIFFSLSILSLVFQTNDFIMFEVMVFLTFAFFLNGIYCLALDNAKESFECRHKWQIRAKNRYGLETYKVCLKCNKAIERANSSHQSEKWQECERIAYLDEQFDENNNYIFPHETH